MELSADGSYVVTRPACQLHERPGRWKFEGFDACSAYLKSNYFRALLSGIHEWAELRGIICRFHDLQCNRKKLEDLGLSKKPIALDRAEKTYRYLGSARDREDLDERLRIYRVNI